MIRLAESERSTESENISSIDVATCIRSDLKRVFPEIGFKVAEDTNSVRVTYVDGIPEQEVVRLIGKYEFGCYDDMSAPKTMNLLVVRIITIKARLAAGRRVCRNLNVSECYADVVHSDLFVYDAGKTMGKLVDMQLDHMCL